MGVLVNPFPDIEPRLSIQQEVTKSKKEKPKSKMKATKDYKLLSFGEEAEDDDDDLERATDKNEKGKSKSAHDLIIDDPKLSSVAPTQQKTRKGSNSDEASDSSEGSEEEYARKHAEEVELIRN